MLAGQATSADQVYRFRLGEGFAALAAGDPARALVAFRYAQEIDATGASTPSPADAYRLSLAVGFAALKANDTAGALAAFRKAVDLKATPESLEAAAQSALRSGRLAEAAAYFERLLAADHDLRSSTRYLEQLSAVYEQMGQMDKAADALRRLPAAAQARPEIIRRQAILAQRLGRSNDAVAKLRALANAFPSEDNLAMLAEAEAAAGQRNAAATTLATILNTPNLSLEKKARYTATLGNIEASRGNPRRAESLFAYSYQLSPAHPPQRLAQAAESAIEAGDWQQAARWYGTLSSDQAIARKSRGDYAARLGFALAQQSRDQEALAAYDEAVRLGAGSPLIHQSRGAALMHLGRAAAAIEEFRTAYDSLPHADIALSLAYAHQAAGQPGLAIVFLRRALADSRALSAAQRRQAVAALGYAYSETDQYAQAAESFERALGIGFGSSTRGTGDAVDSTAGK